jgi:hypothetical protein
MIQSKTALPGFGAPEKYASPLWSGWTPEPIKKPVGFRPVSLWRSVLRIFRSHRGEARSVKEGARWVAHLPTKEQRFRVIDDEGGEIDTWRLRESIARFARGEGERVDPDAIRERFGMPPGK